MDSRSVIFLEVMIAIAAVGVLAFLVFLVGRAVSRAKTSRGDVGDGGAGRWYQYLLAALLLVVIAVLAIWQFSTEGLLGQAADWRAEGRAMTFFVIMLVVGGLGLIGFLVHLIVQASRQASAAPTQTISGAAPAPDAEGAAPEAASQPTPAGLRLLGLLGLLAAFLLLNWIYLPRAEQYSLVLGLIYPASLAVALVLLFDKASRGWNVKDTAENFREWLLCDAMTFLLILAFLNLRQDEGGEKYAAMFWDVLYVASFFLVFWALDRTRTRLRFLFAHAYFIALPILLLIWRAMKTIPEGAPAPPELSWWSTVWPFFFLAIIAFVLEIIVMLIQGSEGKQNLGAVKDAIYVAIYGILLIVAIPEAAE
ncbi:MAG: hypothetical protein QF512_12270 [Alphaproteobacteria bacterium]|nr:hypothetical protein [Alphaproteobacteria bacterium]